MNVQLVNDTIFLAYVAKYIAKPEPIGIIKDNEELRKREKASANERFLNCRLVGMPEACHRVWGFAMKSGTAATHLITKLPHKRMRAVPNNTQTLAEVSDSDSDAETEAEKPMKFLDGVLELYMNRPSDDDAESLNGWEDMKYPDFHRRYKVKRGKDLSKTEITNKTYAACTQRGEPLVANSSDIDPTALYCVPVYARSDATRPVIVDWLLPDKHGDQYFYQLLLLNVPFRSEMPVDFISTENASGTLREECQLRGIIPPDDQGGIEARLRSDATKRYFTEEQINSFCEQFQAHAQIQGNLDASDVAATRIAEELQLNAEDVKRLQDDINSVTTQEDCPAPPEIRTCEKYIEGKLVTEATWHEPSGTSVDAPSNVWKLTASQYESFKLLKEAGHKQLLTFLSGEGGMGKSLLIRLLVQHWRSQGKRVLVCAASAKAARLIGGHTVHSAFQLRLNGGFLETQLNRTEKHNKQWAWLFTRDIIIIDEISMLTAGALHGVNHTGGTMSFIMKKQLIVKSSLLIMSPI